MSDTKIEWADKTWNPVTGCTPAGEGCRHCYAERMSKRLAGRFGYPAENPFSVTVHNEKLDEPSTWKKPSHIFVCSMGDLFHADVPFEAIQQVFTTMEATPHHTYMVLTKRPDRMREYIAGSWDEVTDDAGEVGYYEPSPHIWLGVSAWDQESADKMIPPLLATPAAVRFVSLEPLLGPVSFRWAPWAKPVNGREHHLDGLRGIDWIIVGGETGPGARPMHPEWVRSIRDQCEAVGVPFFFKGWGEYGTSPVAALHRVGKKAAGRHLDGRTHDVYPGGSDE